jgi:hypothetical protein
MPRREHMHPCSPTVYIDLCWLMTIQICHFHAMCYLLNMFAIASWYETYIFWLIFLFWLHWNETKRGEKKILKWSKCNSMKNDGKFGSGEHGVKVKLRAWQLNYCGGRCVVIVSSKIVFISKGQFSVTTDGNLTQFKNENSQSSLAVLGSLFASVLDCFLCWLLWCNFNY